MTTFGLLRDASITTPLLGLLVQGVRSAGVELVRTYLGAVDCEQKPIRGLA